MCETKLDIVNDILELRQWCIDNFKFSDCNKLFEFFGQGGYHSYDLTKSTLLRKKKNVLDSIREQLLEKVVYKEV